MPDITKMPTAEELEAYRKKWAGRKRDAKPGTLAEIKQYFDRRYREPEFAAAKNSFGAYRAPLNSSYRCIAIVRATGNRCTDWAVRGQQRCRFHGGHAKGGFRRLINPVSLLRTLPYVYSRYLGPTLRKRLEELAGAKDKLDLEAELDMVRSVACDAAELYSTVVEQRAAPDSKVGIDAVMAAGGMMKDACNEVAGMVRSIVAVQAARKETLTVASLQVVVAQIVQMAYDSFGEDNIAAVEAFADKLKAIRLPNEAAQGTLLTPDMDVKAMDATVPNVQ